jgi:hypothetical protein
LSAVIAVVTMLPLVSGLTTLISRRWKFFIDCGVKHGDGVFFGAGRGAGSVPPAPAEALKATAAAATVTEVGCGALPEGVVETEDGAVRSAVCVGSPDAPSGCVCGRQ